MEDITNDIVLQNSAVTTRLMALDDARNSGARALFGEKYGDEVRVVAMGEGGNALGWSVELCGGTHVKRTGDIGLISVVGDSAALPPACAGWRRSPARLRARPPSIRRKWPRPRAAELKAPLEDLPARISALLDERRRARARAHRRAEEARHGRQWSGRARRRAPGTASTLLARSISGVSPKDLPA